MIPRDLKCYFKLAILFSSDNKPKILMFMLQKISLECHMRYRNFKGLVTVRYCSFLPRQWYISESRPIALSKILNPSKFQLHIVRQLMLTALSSTPIYLTRLIKELSVSFTLDCLMMLTEAACGRIPICFYCSTGALKWKCSNEKLHDRIKSINLVFNLIS